MQRLAIHINGIVQGVGFRPFVYNLAQHYQLTGWVLNNSQGVEIEAEGDSPTVSRFLEELSFSAPPLAVIEEMTVNLVNLRGDTEFIIRYSREEMQKTAWVSPDVATCSECLGEMTDPADRRYRYGFINCTNCGPRYSIIKDVPYDRAATTMNTFPMCSSCQAEYDNPGNRRFHAQPNACPECGPAFRLLTSEGTPIACDAPRKTRQLIAAGNIVAIKGIGGYHLACDARQEQAVSQLRTRKIREEKPFALMCGSIERIRQICDVSKEEELLLTSSARPIVLLTKKSDSDLAQSVAPGTDVLGMMLPYAPIHWLLLEEQDVWVMTSGNISDEPIVYKDQDAIKLLGRIADYFLVHNREIFQQSDDSVVRITGNKRQILRRSRGFAPQPIKISQEMPSILAVGGEAKNTFCLTRGSFAFMSSHMGDLENMATYEAYLAAIEHYKKLFSIEPTLVAYDWHPEYLASKYALSLPISHLGVQHHHAHIASVLAEHSIDEKVIGVAFDGTGYGCDGTLWGGEFLIADCTEFVRLGHCKYLPLPGGAKAIKEPWRIAAWVLYNLYGQEFAAFDIKLSRNLSPGWELMVQAAAKGINAPLTSSAGRLFDIAAGILGICHTIHYEGQGAIELERAGYKQYGQVLPYDISQASPYILDFMPTFAAMIEAVRKGRSVELLAACFHETIADAVVTMVRKIKEDTGIQKVVLSGGVWQNITILEKVVGILQQDSISVYTNELVPPNDGGLAFGQAAVAGACIRKR
ncbi:carbamoyltransferase HypF [Pelosinus propionicus]|uniref:Carbamoyltransferase n=1 Tax=Pelosinus propionicus DSM 13327 TaxID=1123291 RepID=A0A1I4HY70_9FIRM|nr:carbamoyltransferase HypF [Pelosinus propionicus]SFL46840.1 Hydrogenase maturation protein, carbamoyltransferase HypF [Pelosinus propionicus DSM 13327]